MRTTLELRKIIRSKRVDDAIQLIEDNFPKFYQVRKSLAFTKSIIEEGKLDSAVLSALYRVSRVN